MDRTETRVSLKKYRFLITDDAEDIRLILGVVVKLLNGEIVGRATCGSECIKFYKELRPDIVFLDVMLPDLNGIEITRELMAIDPDAKIIIVSSLAQIEVVEQAITLGAKYFVAKPFKPSDAARLIQKQIEKWSKT